jgi:hypothetical protein
MQVSHNYFVNGIAHFTRRINKCISMACANGEVAPFVGYNAFLRWSALQDAMFEDAEDKKKKVWSESNVSENVDMALRLQVCIFPKRVCHGRLMVVVCSLRDSRSDGRHTWRVASRKVSR